MLKVENLNYRIQNNMYLNHVNFELEEGYILALLGENGSGKSTLLKLIYGMDKVDGGQILWNERAISNQPALMHQEIAFCSMDYSGFVLETSSMENVELFCKLYHNFSMEAFKEYCQSFELDQKLLEKNVMDLSEGQFQKVLLSFEMAKQPKLLLLDECTAVLDSDSRITLMEHLQKLVAKNQTSVIISTHIVDDIEDIADYVLILQEQTQVLFDDCESVKEQYGEFSNAMRSAKKLYEEQSFSEMNIQNKKAEQKIIETEENEEIKTCHIDFLKTLKKHNKGYGQNYRFEILVCMLIVIFELVWRQNNDALTSMGFATVVLACVTLSATRKIAKMNTSFSYILTKMQVASVNLADDIFAHHSVNAKYILTEMKKEVWKISSVTSITVIVIGCILRNSLWLVPISIALSFVIPYAWIHWEKLLLEKQMQVESTFQKSFLYGILRSVIPGIASAIVAIVGYACLIVFAIFGSLLLVSLKSSFADESEMVRTNFSDWYMLVILLFGIITIIFGMLFLCRNIVVIKSKWGKYMAISVGIWIVALILMSGTNVNYTKDEIIVKKLYVTTKYKYDDVESYSISSKDSSTNVKITMKDGSSYNLVGSSSETSQKYDELYYDDYEFLLDVMEKFPNAKCKVESGTFDVLDEEVSGYDSKIYTHFKEFRKVVENK